MTTIKDLILQQSNDYSREEENFEHLTGLNYLSKDRDPFKVNNLTKSISVILPSYIVGRTLPHIFERLSRQSYTNFEVIVVDDGSPIPLDQLIQTLTVRFPVKYIRNETNQGHSYTRNRGISASDGDILIFLEPDIMPHEDFIYNFAVRQHFTSSCLHLGFRENITYETFLVTEREAQLEADWRYEVETDEDTIPISIRQQRPIGTRRKYTPLIDTNYFKDYGYGAIYGYWDLPVMVVGHSMCVAKELARESGGFPQEGFHGWGAQDNAFGALLIARGVYVVPVLNNVSFHIEHERYSGSYEREREELTKNLRSYFLLLERGANTVVFPGQNVNYRWMKNR